MYGLKPHTIKAIQDVFANHKAIEKAILYGSRAKGNYRNGSDIDITLVGQTLTLSQQFSIETEVDDLLLPYKMDISIFHKIENEDLIDHINRVGISLYYNVNQVKKNYQDFKSFVYKKIGADLNCSFLSGYGFKSSNFSETGIPLIKIGNIQNKLVKTSLSVNCLPESILNEKSKNYLLENGDILIAMTGQGSVGRVGRLMFESKEEKALLNQRVGKFLCNEVDLNREFLFYVLTSDSYQDYLFSTGTGSGQPNLSPSLILDTEIPTPSYKEQKTIANILSSLDNKIDLLNRQNKTLEALSKALFRQFFIEQVNEEWEEESLSSVADFLNGLACQKHPPKNEIDKINVLKIRELKAGFTDNSDFVSTEVNEKYLVQNGDVIFSWSASLVVKIWDGEDCILNQHLFKVTSEHFPKWFYYLWSKYHLDMFIAIAKAHATTMGHIKRGDLDDAMVIIPPPSELAKMSKTFTPLIDKIIANNKQIKQVEKLRDTLLPKLMSGEVRMQI
jgi:type I restriction enzyme S subunit